MHVSVRSYHYNQGHQLVLEYQRSGSLDEGLVMGMAGDEHSGLASVTVSGTPATQWGDYFSGQGLVDSESYIQVIATDHLRRVAIGNGDFVIRFRLGRVVKAVSP